LDRTRSILALLLLCSAAAPAEEKSAGKPDRGERVETIDAAVLAGRVVSITDKAVFVQAGEAGTTLPRERVVEVFLSASGDLFARKGQAVLVTSAGDALAVEDVRLAGGSFRFRSPLLGRAAMKMEFVRAIYFPAAAQSAGQVRQQCRRRNLRASPQDLLVVEKKVKDQKNLIGVSGVLESISAQRRGRRRDVEITFRWQGRDRTIALKTVRAILLAGAAPAVPRPGGAILGRCGSKLYFTAVTLEGDAFEVRTSQVGRVRIPRGAVAGVRLTSDRIVDLTGLKPLRVREYGFLDRGFPHRIGKAVSGRPAEMGGKTYRRVLGVHSFCELTYRLDGRYAQFVSIVGIDDAVRPGGDAELSILGDGKVLAGPLRLTGKDAPRTLRARVSGVKEMTIRVSFGKDALDVADHVNLAAPRLIKAPK